MNLSFFPKIAISSIRNNRKLYYPYFLTGICIVAINYIIDFVTFDEALSQVQYIGSLQQITFLGIFVLAIFSAFFLIYTNSFLIKKRKNEFGLYNVLGMSKKNIALVLVFETLIIMSICIVIGLFFGILFSKIAQLILLKLVNQEAVFTFSVSYRSIIFTLVVFVPLYFLILLLNIIHISKLKTIDLIKSEQEAEKKPNANIFIAIAGLFILMVAYYLAISVKNGVEALTLFFIAVILVIIATNLLFIFASVTLCQFLKKKKNYYYQTSHYISTSSMTFRMKRNGRGLATICILSTMVLVMISTTASLYFSVDSIIQERYPKEINMEFRYNKNNQINDETVLLMNELFENTTKQNGIQMKNVVHYQYSNISGYLDYDRLHYENVNSSDFNLSAFDIMVVELVSLSDYNRLTNQTIVLPEGQTLLYENGCDIKTEQLKIDDFTFRLVSPEKLGAISQFEIDAYNYEGVMNCIILVVDNYDLVREKLISLKSSNESTAFYVYKFDTGVSDEKNIKLREDLSQIIQDNLVYNYCNLKARCIGRQECASLYGALFFLGITLSLVFVFATVLIIYYKQVSEGYEDQPNFEIMKKVGINDKDIRKAINSQMVTVFFAPLLMAIIHLIFSTPMVMFLLKLLNMTQTKPFIISLVISIGLYAIVYGIIYKITSNTYYKIVNTSLKEQ